LGTGAGNGSGILATMSADVQPRSSSQFRAVTLFVPGLQESGIRSKPVRKLLARSDLLPAPPGWTARHFSLFGIDRVAGADYPVAAVTRLADMGVVDRDWWIRADPVYLEPRRDSLILRASLDLDRHESSALASELNESLMLDGWVLRAPHPDRWYIKPTNGFSVTTTPVTDAIGKNVDPLLPAGVDRTLWNSRLAELQIILHTSSVNAAREHRGLLPANSVWFWGGGRLPTQTAVTWNRVLARDPLSIGLARLSQVESRPISKSQDAMIDLSVAGETLVVPEDANIDLSEGFLETVAQTWIQPLAAAVHRGELDTLTLVSDRGPRFEYRKRFRWRIWRQRPSPSGWQDDAA